MVEALATDLAAIDGVSVNLMCDQRIPISAAGCRVVSIRSIDEALAVFEQLATEADLTLMIAPESGGALLSGCRQVEMSGGRLLGPGLSIVEMCGDKHATAQHLAADGVPVPRGMAVEAGQSLPADFSYPAVIKPRDGCGSQDVRLITSAADADLFGPVPWPARLECFCPGVAASMAVLCGPRELRALTPCRQRLSDDGRFQYLGGAIPLRPELARRAVELALRAVETLPEPRGYVGVDLVLGEVEGEGQLVSQGDSPIFAQQKVRQPGTKDTITNPGGQPDFAGAKLVPRRAGISQQSSADFVIEINPRLTTSYVGLRAACQGNLAEAMLRIAAGEAAELSFRDDPLQFDADGTVHFN